MKTLESIFDIDKSGPELLRNVAIGEVIFGGTFDGELVYPKVVNDHTIEIVPPTPTLTVSLKPELKECTDLGITVLKSDCTLDLSKINKWDKPIEIKAPEIHCGMCSYKNIKFTDKDTIFQFAPKELKNCTIYARSMTLGTAKVGYGGTRARYLQKTLKLPFKNCTVKLTGRTDVECMSSVITKEFDRLKSIDNPNLTKELNLSGIDFDFIEYSFRNSNKLLCISRNLKNIPKLYEGLSWKKSMDGIFYEFTNQKVLMAMYELKKL